MTLTGVVITNCKNCIAVAQTQSWQSVSAGYPAWSQKDDEILLGTDEDNMVALEMKHGPKRLMSRRAFIEGIWAEVNCQKLLTRMKTVTFQNLYSMYIYIFWTLIKMSSSWLFTQRVNVQIFYSSFFFNEGLGHKIYTLWQHCSIPLKKNPCSFMTNLKSPE